MKNKILLSSAVLCAVIASTCIAGPLSEKVKLPPKRKIKIKVSPETTFVDDLKLKPDGTPDFVEWHNRKFSKGVTKDNNAARDLFCTTIFSKSVDPEYRKMILKYFKIKPEEILSPKMKLTLDDYSGLPYKYSCAIENKEKFKTKIDPYKFFKPFYEMPEKQKQKFLQAFKKSIISGKPAPDSIFREWEAWLAKPSGKKPEDDINLWKKFSLKKNEISLEIFFYEQYEFIENSSDLKANPHLAALISSNSNILSKLHKASRKSKIYYPLDPEKITRNLFSPKSSHIFEYIDLLIGRASFRIALNKTENGIKDFHTVISLAKLFRNKPYLTAIYSYDFFKAQLMRAIFRILENNNLTKKQIHLLQNFCKTLPSDYHYPHNLETDIAKLKFVYSIISFNKKHWDELLSFQYQVEDRSAEGWVSGKKLLKNLKPLNEKGINDVLKLYVSYTKEFQNLADKLKKTKSFKTTYIALHKYRTALTKKYSKLPIKNQIAFDIASLLYLYNLNDYDMRINAHHLHLHQNRVINISLALELYKIDNRRYPDTLEKLVPKYMKKIPRDVYRPNKSISYIKIKSKNEYWLYIHDKWGDPIPHKKIFDTPRQYHSAYHFKKTK